MQNKNDKSVVAKRTTARTVSWCYTYNNPTAAIPFNAITMLYHVYGDEKGESGTPHYQGFIVFKNRQLFNAVKALCPEAHWEAAKGTYQQAADYCKKDGVFKEEGEMPEPPTAKGQRAGTKAMQDKWRFISDSAKKGDLAAIDADHPKQFVNSYRNLVAIRKDFTPRLPDLLGVCGVWYYGKAGVGKTRLLTAKYPNAYLKRMNKWFDGYNGEEVVAIDDLGLDHKFMGYELKKLADRYCYMVEVKNASMYIRPKKCVVTSQYRIEDVWADDKETREALQRRFVQVEVTPNNIELNYITAMERLAKKNGSNPEEQTPVLVDNDITVEEFDSIMEKYNAKPATVEEVEKLPKKLQPVNKYFREKPLRFAPYKKKFFTPRLIRKNAMVEKKKKEEVEEILSSSEDEEMVEPEAPALHEYYDMHSYEALSDCSTPEEIDSSDVDDSD